MIPVSARCVNHGYSFLQLGPWSIQSFLCTLSHNYIRKDTSLMLHQRLILASVAILVVLACVVIRGLAPGWLLVLFGIAYLPLLSVHIFIHARYAASLPPKISTLIAIIASHLAVLLAFLF